jgi:hypothetical protein
LVIQHEPGEPGPGILLERALNIGGIVIAGAPIANDGELKV